MSGAYRNQVLAVLFVMGVIAGCASRPVRAPTTPGGAPSSQPAPAEQPGAHRGRAFLVAPEESLLTVLVYRGGALARAGHNHVIASHEMTGFAWVPEDVALGSFEVHVPVSSFAIDEPALRAQEGPDFATEVPDSAREGTKKNMLSETMLDGQRFPEIVLRSTHLELPPGPVDRAAGNAVALVSVTVRGQTRPVSVPLSYELNGDTLRVKGELSLKQTDLGLTPFSLLGGALRVEDEMRVKFSVVAHGG